MSKQKVEKSKMERIGTFILVVALMSVTLGLGIATVGIIAANYLGKTLLDIVVSTQESSSFNTDNEIINIIIGTSIIVSIGITFFLDKRRNQKI